MSEEIVEITREREDGGLFTKLFFERGLVIDGRRSFCIDVSTVRMMNEGRAEFYETMGFSKEGSEGKDRIVYGPVRIDREGMTFDQHFNVIRYLKRNYFHQVNQVESQTLNFQA